MGLSLNDSEVLPLQLFSFFFCVSPVYQTERERERNWRKGKYAFTPFLILMLTKKEKFLQTKHQILDFLSSVVGENEVKKQTIEAGTILPYYSPT